MSIDIRQHRLRHVTDQYLGHSHHLQLSVHITPAAGGTSSGIRQWHDTVMDILSFDVRY